MIVWIIFSLVLVLFYLVLLVFFSFGFQRIKSPDKLNKPINYVDFNVLIPVRNEENQIVNLLNGLIKLDYPKSHFKITLLNDHSTDKTAQKINEFILNHPSFPLQQILMERVEGIATKKEAITYGVEQTDSEWIVLTDADCKHPSTWLSALNEKIQMHNAKFIYAPVEFASTSFFEHLQALEFAGLVAIGAAAIELKLPNMCSAANLAFKRQVFLDVGGYTENKHLASGDDEFLLHKVFKKYPTKVYFLKDIRALVSTGANASVKQLAEQRKRWVSKSTHYQNRYITGILIAAYLFNFSCLVNAILTVFLPEILPVFLVQLGVKIGVEFLVIFPMLRFLGRQKLIYLLPLAEPFHILYVLWVGIAAQMGTYNWKDRKLN